ncbi:MAG: hypothetical protein ACE361_05315 [Aureliella sp.]
MSKRSFRIAVFLMALIVGDQLGGAALNELVGRSGQRFSAIYRGDLNADVVILGNSRGIHMFHPPALSEALDRRFANLAFNDLPPAIMPLLWEDYLKSHPAPKRIILEVSSVGVQDYPGSLERFSYLIDCNPEIRSIIAKENRLHANLSQVSRLFRYNSPLTWRSLLFLCKSDQSWIMNSQLNGDMFTKAIEESDAELRFDAARASALAEVVRLSQERGIMVECVLAPYEPRYAKRLERKKEWLEWLQGQIHHPIEDLSGALPDSIHFADHLHLHEDGAAHFAKEIRQEKLLRSNEW